MPHVAITGASSGIGEALAREFARAGADVTLVARRRDRLEALAREVGGRTHVADADLCDVDRACDWLAGAEAALGPVDVLVNNAGVQIVGPTATTDPDAADALLRVDLVTPLRLARAVLPAMLARRAGVIVNVASLAALAPTPGMFYYNAAKAGLAAASEALRGELRGTGVHVVTVYPGPVDTAMARAAIASTGGSRAAATLPIGTTEALARLVRSAVERRRARVVYPRAYVLARHFPAITRWVMDRLTPPFAAPT